MASTSVYLVRHGEQDLLGGHAIDSGLSDAGCEQARRLGRRLSGVPFSQLHHSPLHRAKQTADIVAGHLLDVPMHPCGFAADRTPVPAAGQESQYPHRYRPWLELVPELERDEGAMAVSAAAVEHFGTVGDEDRKELVITHNFVIGWFVRYALDAPPWRWIGLNQSNCALTVVRWETGRPPTLISFNDVGHLE